MKAPLLYTQISNPLPPAFLQNRVLAGLNRDTIARLLPEFELVHMPLGTVIYEPGVRAEHVYFPVDCIISTLYVLEDGDSTEVSVVGNEGMIGISSFLEGNTTPSRAAVCGAGNAYRIKTKTLEDEFKQHSEFLSLTLRFTKSLIIQISQTVACNRCHNIDQQLSRWILSSMDRLCSNQLNITQELLAHLLGVRRETITNASKKLRDLGVITTSRGKIIVVNRAHLEALSCECYGVIKAATDRLLPPLA